MNIRKTFAKFLHKKLQKRIQFRQPDFTVGFPETGIYLKRWWLIPRNPFFNVYYHNFKRSDVDLALHNHSYINMSFLLDGEYFEHTEKNVFNREVGDIKIRLPQTLHRIELKSKCPPMQLFNLMAAPGSLNPIPMECWSLFITGPRVREWGFQDGPVTRNWLGFKTKENWLDHRTFIAKYQDKLNYK